MATLRVSFRIGDDRIEQLALGGLLWKADKLRATSHKFPSHEAFEVPPAKAEIDTIGRSFAAGQKGVAVAEIGYWHRLCGKLGRALRLRFLFAFPGGARDYCIAQAIDSIIHCPVVLAVVDGGAIHSAHERATAIRCRRVGISRRACR